jgi:CelD/BcsL family acetyltransferase involved in cellulose biosynthesis
MGDCHCGSEYPDIIAAPDTLEAIFPYIEECLNAHPDKWDCLYFRHVSGWTDAASRLARFCTRKRTFFRQQEAVFSSIPLPESIDEYNRNILGPVGKQKKKTGQIRRKLERLGRLSITLCQQEQELPLFLDSLFSLHKKRWEAAGQRGSFVRRPLMQDFYRGFAATALREGWLKLFALRIDDTILAVQIGYLYNGVFYALQEGFDPDGPQGLGNVLRHAVIDWCITNKVREYDYLGGNEEHKLQWGAKQRTGRHLFCGRQSPKNLLLAAADIWPSGRFITEGAPGCYGCSND